VNRRRLLFDSHAFLWAAGAPEQLSPAVRELLESTDAQFYLSAATVWEVSFLIATEASDKVQLVFFRPRGASRRPYAREARRQRKAGAIARGPAAAVRKRGSQPPSAPGGV
jgi:hypothetical protein